MNFAIFLLFLCFHSLSGENWNRYLKLDRNYEVWWSVEGEWVTFQVEVATRGWIGFGISPNGGMAGSDLVIGWVNNGKAWFHDRHAEGNFQPSVDNHQDWELLWCCENDTHTTMSFKRMLITCDDQDLSITNDTTRFIYAYHSDDPPKPDTVMYHGARRRGTVSVMINYNLDKPIHYESPEDIEHWDVTSPNILLPDDKDTAYYCTFLRRPHLDKQHHIVKVAPLIQPGNEKFVHHIILYECMIDEEVISPFTDGTYYECFDDDGIPKFPYCFTSSIGWAVGGGDMYFPEKVGIPIGMSKVVWYLLQIHYDNPEFARGVFDSSGLRISYTPKLRQYDGSMLTIGSLWYPCVFVPPNQKEFIISGHGHPSCLRQGIPPEGIKIFSSLLHSHLIAKKITVRHFRNNEELPPLDVDKYYDFNYQEYRRLPEERLLLPNDHVIVECTYDSSKRIHTTFGGLATKEEMCLAFLSYYPKQNISAATSCPLPTNVLKPIGVEKLSDDARFVVSPLNGKNQSYYNFLDSYSWDETSVNQIQKAMMYSPHINFCLDTNGKGIENYILSRYPKVKRSYREPDICASRENPIRDIPPRTKPSRPITPKMPEITLAPRSDQITRIPQNPFPPKRTTQIYQTNFPPNVRPATRKPQRKFPPVRITTRYPWRTTQMPETDFPATRKPQRKFPPVRITTRNPWRTTQMPETDFPATRKPQRKFPPVRITTRNPPWKPPSSRPSFTRRPPKPFPPNTRQDGTTTEKTEITTDKPKSELVPHVFPYPIIDQVIRESG